MDIPINRLEKSSPSYLDPLGAPYSGLSFLREKVNSSALDSMESRRKTERPCCLGRLFISLYQFVTSGLRWLWNCVFCCQCSETLSPASSSEKSAGARQLEKVLAEFVAKKEELDQDKFSSWWKKRFNTLASQVQRGILLEEIAEHASSSRPESQTKRQWAETHFEEWERRAKQVVVDLDWKANEDPSVPIESTERYMQRILERI